MRVGHTFHSRACCARAAPDRAARGSPRSCAPPRPPAGRRACAPRARPSGCRPPSRRAIPRAARPCAASSDSPMKSLFDTAASSGSPSSSNSSNRRVSSSECSVFLSRSWPGSTISRSRGTPAASARVDPLLQERDHLGHHVVVAGGRLLGARRADAVGDDQRARRMPPRHPPSPRRRSPLVSLITRAPAAIAARATSAE